MAVSWNHNYWLPPGRDIKKHQNRYVGAAADDGDDDDYDEVQYKKSIFVIVVFCWRTNCIPKYRSWKKTHT